MATSPKNSPIIEKLHTVKKKHVAITGTCWEKRAVLIRKIKKAGGIVAPKGAVTNSTDVLVRGHSENWKHKDYGTKELKVAKLIRDGKLVIVVHDDAFCKWLESRKAIAAANYVAGQPIAWLLPSTQADFEEAAGFQGPLDREQTVLGRKEQGYLRKLLFKGERAYCCLCGREWPVDLMVAAHIKPRSECSEKQRRDAANIAFGVCLLGCDALYEKGYVSVNPKGAIVTASAKGLPDALKGQIKKLQGRPCSAWGKQTAGYFDWHYQRRFRG